jgi:tRNA 2-selenouridine synthase
MRSASVGWLLEQAGFRVLYLQGGYKAYRRHVLDTLAVPRPLLVLGGMTGAGKTEVLRELAALGSQTLDLEGLAAHRGSAFGALPGREQPRIEQFENLLADEASAMDPDRPVWVEDESRNLGRVNIPRPFFAHMGASPLVRLDVPRADRTERIARGYDPAHAARAAEGLDRIRKRLGGENHRAAKEALAAGDYARVTDLLLDYYDRAYAGQLARRPSAAHALAVAPGEAPLSLAKKLRAWELAGFSSSILAFCLSIG